MKLTFRQGLVRYQTDSVGTPTFLRVRNQYVDLIVNPTPTTFTIAHFDQDYLFSEPRTALNAWGPFEEGEDYYLYWDVDLLTGELSRGYTTVQPAYLPTAPHPEIDLHWFDLTNTVMKVWSGESWVVKLRVFAAFFANGTYLIPYDQVKSQASIDKVNITAGYPIFDEAEPVRRYRKDNMGVFVHTGTLLHPQWSKLANYRLRNAIRESSAIENIPANYAVGYRGVDNVTGLVRHTIPIYSAVGITADAVVQGNYHTFISHGYVTNENWNWDVYGSEPAGSAVFVGIDGSLTTTSPQTGSTQRIGTIVDRNTIYVNVRPIIIFDEDEFVWPVIIFDAGEDQNVLCDNNVQLEARVIAGNIQNHTFEWEQISGTPVTLENANTLSPSFTNPNTVDLEFRLWVDRGTPFEQFSDVNIFRQLASSATPAITGSSQVLYQTALDVGRISSDARMVQNATVELTSYNDQLGNFADGRSLFNSNPYFIQWTLPSGRSSRSIFLGVEIQRWNPGLQQWVYDGFQPESLTYYNIQTGTLYRLVMVWNDLLRNTISKETNNQIFKTPGTKNPKPLVGTSATSSFITGSGSIGPATTSTSIPSLIDQDVETFATPAITSSSVATQATFSVLIPSLFNIETESTATPAISGSGASNPNIFILRASGISIGSPDPEE